jgi:hypothetical protein
VNRVFAFPGVFIVPSQLDETKPIAATNCDFRPESLPPSRELKIAEQSQSRRRLSFSETGKAGGELETAEQSQFAPRTTGAPGRPRFAACCIPALRESQEQKKIN